MDKELNELISRLRGAAGDNLRSVVLYGSAASGDYQPGFSDLNVLCLLQTLDAAALRQLHAPVKWWTGKGQPAPIVFTADELQRSADVFAIELMDIQASHRVLYGDDAVSSLEVPTSLHRLQVERELRNHVVRLRESYLAAPNDHKALFQLMTASVSSFATLFRHALIALGQAPSPPSSKHDAVDRLAALLAFDAAPFHTVLALREGRTKENAVDVGATFAGYLAGVMRVADEVDQRLSVS